MSALMFGAPGYRWVAVAAVLVLAVAYAFDITRRRRALERAGQPFQLRQMMASYAPARRALRAVLATGGLALALVAMSRPQVEGATRWQQRGIDIAIVMDYSKSMLARDVYPSRYQRVELEVEALLRELEGDRVAIVTFAGASAHLPLTHDLRAAALLFEGLTPLDMPPGSDLGAAILRARCVVRPDLLDDPGCERVGGRGRGGEPLDGAGEPSLRELPTDRTGIDRARAIVIFTDGEDTEGKARAELVRAVELGIEVFLVGVGTPSGELIPELDAGGRELGWKKTADGRSFVTTRLEEGALRELAGIAGGADRYLRLDPRRPRPELLAELLERLEQGDLDERVVRTRREVYAWALFPAFLLLLVEACIADRRRGQQRRRA